MSSVPIAGTPTTVALAPDDLDGPVRVIAGPGAGKTRLLVDLYVDLVRSGRAHRGEILVLTFSTAAADEIARRVDDRLDDSYEVSWISTFHSFCARLLRDHRPDPNRLLMSSFQEWLAMRVALAALVERDRTALGALAAVAGTDTFAQDAAAFVALLKQNQVHPAVFALLAEARGTARLRALAAVYGAYQARCDDAGLRDFRDLVADAIGLLEAKPELSSLLRERFRYVLVDEFQDVDPAQFHLLRILSPPTERPRLLVAGDPDQSIYGFRGTVPSLLGEEFPRLYGSRSIDLTVSHRCPAEVLVAGTRLLEATQPGRRSRLFTSTGGDTDATRSSVRVVREPDAVDEAVFVAREMRRLMLEEPDLRPGDFAVLLRSTTARAAPFEDAIRALGLPYEVRGVGGMARNEIVRFLLAYLRAVERPDHPESLARVIASGLSGVAPSAASRLRQYAIEEGRPFVRVVNRLLYWLQAHDPGRYPLPWAGGAAPEGRAEPQRPEVRGGAQPPSPPPYAQLLTEDQLATIHGAVTAYHRVRRKAGTLPIQALAYAILIEAGVTERVLALPLSEADRVEALGELRVALEAIGELEAIWHRLHGAPPLLADLAGRLEGLVAQAVDDAEPAPRRRDAVQVMTVHQAKGLEFEVVFVSGFGEGLFPPAARPHPVLDEADQDWLRRNLDGFQPAWPASSEEHVAEDARLAYVGMTRARRRLYLTFADTYETPAGPSPFLKLALPDTAVEQRGTSPLAGDVASVLTLGEAETVLAGARLDPDHKARLAALSGDLAFVSDPESGHPFLPYARHVEGVQVGHFSPTSLNDYLKCPRLYWYGQHPGLAQAARGPELERGSFLHEVLEEFHRREVEWRPLPPEAQREWLLAVLQPRLEGYLDGQEAVLERKAEELEVRRILDNYIGFATRSQPIRRLGTVAVERRFTLEVDGAEIHGKIDRINDTGEGTCEVVDYKTGRGKSANQAYREYFGPTPIDVQLLMYELACRDGRDEDGEPLALRPRFLSLWYPKELRRNGQIRQVLFAVGDPAPGVDDWTQKALGADDLAHGRQAVAAAIRRIRGGDFAPDPRDAIGTCLSWFGCPHAAICPFGGTPQE